jgi:hypothetical protein
MKLFTNLFTVFLLGVVLLTTTGCDSEVVGTDLRFILFEPLKCPKDRYPKFIQDISMPITTEDGPDNIHFGFTSIEINRKDITTRELKEPLRIDYLNNVSTNFKKVKAVRRALETYYAESVADSLLLYTKKKEYYHSFRQYLSSIADKEYIFLYSPFKENSIPGYDIYTSIPQLRKAIGNMLLKSADPGQMVEVIIIPPKPEPEPEPEIEIEIEIASEQEQVVQPVHESNTRDHIQSSVKKLFELNQNLTSFSWNDVGGSYEVTIKEKDSHEKVYGPEWTNETSIDVTAINALMDSKLYEIEITAKGTGKKKGSKVSKMFSLDESKKMISPTCNH